ncbi:MAG TPA: dynamin family protein [Chitinophagaceae bacterium]|nr:dynamin family protein [Chitinophagaceae bacterium]
MNTGYRFEDLHHYKQARLHLADLIRIISEGLKALELKKAQVECDELLIKLAEDRFTLAVLGLFKQGKSTLMNALIGENILPTGVLPLTSVITVLKYGPQKKLLIERDAFMFTQEEPVSSLAEYVTEKGNPGNEKHVKKVIAELPSPFLQAGVEFVDTPGVGSSIEANTRTTYSFLPECDAVLFVTGTEAPVTETEIRFLNDIKKYTDRIFFVVNKMDLVSPEEINEITTFIQKTLRLQGGFEQVRLFAVSARMGINAKEKNDHNAYKKSGLETLENMLTSFMSARKTDAFLKSIVQKLLKIIDDETGKKSFDEAALQNKIATFPPGKNNTLKKDPHIIADRILQATENIRALQKSLQQDDLPELPAVYVADNKKSKPAFSPATGNKTGKIDIVADLQNKTCPVCAYLVGKTFDFMAYWQYQITADEKFRDEFAGHLGFCPLHTWQLLAISSPQGASIGFAKLFLNVSRRLNKLAQEPFQKKRVADLVHDRRNCPVCMMLREEEINYIHALSETVNTSDGMELYKRSAGVCMRHLDVLLQEKLMEKNYGFLLLHSMKNFERDVEDMQSYVLKRDARRRDLINKDEENAYIRSAIRLAGDRNYTVAWPSDAEI